MEFTPKQVVEELNKYIIGQNEAKKAVAVALRNSSEKFIWAIDREDIPCNPSTFRKKYKKAIESAGVRYLPPHNCRHTYITIMQSLGVDMATIQALAGHSDLEMTKHYLHVLESVKTEAVDKLAAFLSE